MNLFSAELGSLDGRASLKLGSNVLGIPAAVLGHRPGLSRHTGQSLVVGFRPEDVADAAVSPAATANRIKSTASLVEALGSDVLVHFPLDAQPTEVQSSDSLQQIKRSASDTGGEAIARLTPRSSVSLGAPVEFVIDTERLHFFDPATGEAIWT
jgi:multiple sugar transport system ATP-binding protein